MTQPQQQLTLNPIQMLQITDSVLAQLKEWVEKKKGTEAESHPAHDVTAARSLHHARLLCGLKMRELVVEIQKRREEEQKKVISQLPPQSQLNLAAARVVGRNTAAQSLDELWAQMGISHYIDTGRP